MSTVSEKATVQLTPERMEQIEAAILESRSTDKAAALLRVRATTRGFCDAEYCP